jgi:hypothetical protein
MHTKLNVCTLIHRFPILLTVIAFFYVFLNFSIGKPRWSMLGLWPGNPLLITVVLRNHTQRWKLMNNFICKVGSLCVRVWTCIQLENVLVYEPSHLRRCDCAKFRMLTVLALTCCWQHVPDASSLLRLSQHSDHLETVVRITGQLSRFINRSVVCYTGSDRVKWNKTGSSPYRRQCSTRTLSRTVKPVCGRSRWELRCCGLRDVCRV